VLEGRSISFGKELYNTWLYIEQYIAMQIKSKRHAQGLKITDVARMAELSRGMVSKIENTQISTSLKTLG
jgi:predicted transcriptional regulator